MNGYTPYQPQMPGVSIPPPPSKKRRDRKQLFILGTLAGLGVLGFYLASNLIVSLVYLLGLQNLYEQSESFAAAVLIFCSISGIFGSFYLVMRLRKDSLPRVRASFGKPYRKDLMALAVPAGMLMGIGASYVTAGFVTLMEHFGMKLNAPEFTPSFTPGGLALAILEVAVVPALVEEFALRGVVMQQLRRYGDRFAIVTSAGLFAIMHGNLIQAPFALMLGVALGYYVIMTGSVWTGVIIHFCNNCYSVVMSALIQEYGQAQVAPVLFGIIAVIALTGAAGIALFHRKSRGRRLCPPPKDSLSAWGKAGSFFASPLMLAAIALLVFTTWQTIEFV